MIYLDKFFVALALLTYPVGLYVAWNEIGVDFSHAISRVLITAYVACAGPALVGAVYLFGALLLGAVKFLFS